MADSFIRSVSPVRLDYLPLAGLTAIIILLRAIRGGGLYLDNEKNKNMNQQVLDRIVIQAGDDIFAEGDYGNSAYVVQDGVIDIIKNTPEGEVVLGTVEKGGIFGEMALIDDQPRMATARAATVVTIIVISRDVFNRKLAKCDPFVRGLLGIFVKNIRSMVDRQLGV